MSQVQQKHCATQEQFVLYASRKMKTVFFFFVSELVFLSYFVCGDKSGAFLEYITMNKLHITPLC